MDQHITHPYDFLYLSENQYFSAVSTHGISVKSIATHNPQTLPRHILVYSVEIPSALNFNLIYHNNYWNVLPSLYSE
jgi:hypothetical protein